MWSNNDLIKTDSLRKNGEILTPKTKWPNWDVFLKGQIDSKPIIAKVVAWRRTVDMPWLKQMMPPINVAYMRLQAAMC